MVTTTTLEIEVVAEEEAVTVVATVWLGQADDWRRKARPWQLVVKKNVPSLPLLTVGRPARDLSSRTLRDSNSAFHRLNATSLLYRQ